jgi:hypothetical protein
MQRLPLLVGIAKYRKEPPDDCYDRSYELDEDVPTLDHLISAEIRSRANPPMKYGDGHGGQ